MKPAVAIFAIFLIFATTCHASYAPYVRPGHTWGGWSVATPVQQQPQPVACFYQNRYCQGSRYTVPIGRGECQTLPRELCDWNLSLETGNSCIQVFSSDNCSETSTFRKWGLASSAIFRANQCTSTKLNGFDVVRSFRRCAC
ncbi:uncharacterized protein LOC110855989 [Folsomia candida]|nr:uncharacterized protein LOC110855989 [Folsomia candida]